VDLPESIKWTLDEVDDNDDGDDNNNIIIIICFYLNYDKCK